MLNKLGNPLNQYNTPCY